MAVVPPDDLVEELDAFLEPRRDAGRADGLRWSPAEQWHVTLAFADSVPDRALEPLVDHLGAAASRRTPFTLGVARGGAFPDVARARLLYAGLEDPDGALPPLSEAARAAVVRAGAEVDGQRFRPHLTLARLNRPRDVVRWVRLLDTWAALPWTVDRLAVVVSHLGEGPRGAPRHEVVAEVPLGD